eukprot:scaffold1026_cov409-Prasinococcus_capsulatus_cf.AAC.12
MSLASRSAPAAGAAACKAASTLPVHNLKDYLRGSWSIKRVLECVPQRTFLARTLRSYFPEDGQGENGRVSSFEGSADFREAPSAYGLNGSGSKVPATDDTSVLHYEERGQLTLDGVRLHAVALQSGKKPHAGI